MCLQQFLVNSMTSHSRCVVSVLCPSPLRLFMLLCLCSPSSFCIVASLYDGFGDT